MSSAKAADQPDFSVLAVRVSLHAPSTGGADKIGSATLAKVVALKPFEPMSKDSDSFFKAIRQGAVSSRAGTSYKELGWVETSRGQVRIRLCDILLPQQTDAGAPEGAARGASSLDDWIERGLPAFLAPIKAAGFAGPREGLVDAALGTAVRPADEIALAAEAMCALWQRREIASALPGEAAEDRRSAVCLGEGQSSQQPEGQGAGNRRPRSL
jgi:hypothetical protein